MVGDHNAGETKGCGLVRREARPWRAYRSAYLASGANLDCLLWARTPRRDQRTHARVSAKGCDLIGVSHSDSHTRIAAASSSRGDFFQLSGRMGCSPHRRSSQSMNLDGLHGNLRGEFAHRVMSAHATSRKVAKQNHEVHGRRQQRPTKSANGVSLPTGQRLWREKKAGGVCLALVPARSTHPATPKTPPLSFGIKSIRGCWCVRQAKKSECKGAGVRWVFSLAEQANRTARSADHDHTSLGVTP